MAYPLGFYEKEVTEAFHCFDHNHNTQPEIDFNNYIYFYSNTGRLITKVVDHETLRDILAKLEERQGLLNKLMMVDEYSIVYPAHFPNAADVIALPTVQAAIRELEEGPVEYEGVTPFVPKLLNPLIDPKPVLARAGPIYSIRNEAINCNFGCYSDEILFFQVRSTITNLNFTVFRDKFIEEDPSSRYQSVKLVPEVGEGDVKLEVGASVVLWNGRRITRPSFGPHFDEVIKTHKPILMIITEVGAQSTNCERVLKGLNTSMAWKVDDGKGAIGGCVVLWDPCKVQSEVIVADKICKIDLRIVGSVCGVGMN